MRVTDLLGMTVYDRSGQHVGAVRDLHFEAGGPVVPDSGQPAYRLIEIECGAVGMAHRLGYSHRDLTGPWPLNRILARLARGSLFARWDQIASLHGDRIELAVPAAELRRLGNDADD
ncbi:PRC-barrel domain-containing protein [Mycobacterium sp.]|uniref:PRC-barrel domain-containing protein n=1 Tax=Mycobacterium sp. TaxID=1785 RepID=UPI00260F89D1|nr:PRC-barrel domain-containing protein [Mycobacterium sp.]